MESLTSDQARGVFALHERLVRAGIAPDVAGALLHRAVRRVTQARDDGLGLVPQTRRLVRGPGVPPRYVDPTERCVRIDIEPGRETEAIVSEQEYRNRGWNIMRITPIGLPEKEIIYACPPGQMPREHRTLIMSSGIGQVPLEAIKGAAEIAPVKAVREAVSPWLWVLSITGFGLTLLNTRRIARMVKGWAEKVGVRRRS